jgi:fatty-acyl-CoA synthase
MTIGSTLIDAAYKRPDASALMFPDVELSARSILDKALGLSRALVALGTQPGDNVGIFLENSPEYVATFFAIALCGAIPVPINARLRGGELAHVVQDAEVRVLFVGDETMQHTDLAGRLVSILPEIEHTDEHHLRLTRAPYLKVIVSFGKARVGMLSADAFREVGAEVDDQVIYRRCADVGAEDIALVLYSSGTTDVPKGCMLSHRAFIRPAYDMATVRFNIHPGDRMFNPLPLFHIGGLTPLLGCIIGGGTFCGMRRFDVDLALEFMVRSRPTLAQPSWDTIWSQVQSHHRFPELDLKSLRDVLLVGVPARLADYQRHLPGVAVTSGYGLSEGGLLTFSVASDPLEARINTVGSTAPGVAVRVVDTETGIDVAPGEQGELLFAGPTLFHGYYRDPELSARALDSAGWLHSGDLGIQRPDGRVVYRGRIKDMLKVGGENVSAAEVENLLLQHESVQLAYVVSAPDDHYGEVAAAFVELKYGERVSEAELIAYCRANIAGYKVPRYLRFVTEWPMSATKVQKEVLRRRIRDDILRSR